jgi:hypothetical protein
MSTDRRTGVLPPSEPSDQARDSIKIRRVFIGPNGIRAGWRFAIFLALLAIFRRCLAMGDWIPACGDF